MIELPALASRPHKGVHAAFLNRQVPNWLQRVAPDDLKTLRKGVLAGLDSADLQAPWFTRASAQQRQALLDCIAASVSSSHALARSLKGFKGITEFAEPLLKQALLDRFGSAPDVTRTHLYHLRAQQTPVEQPLLQAALLNFEGDTAFDEVSLHETSAIAPAGALLCEKDGPEKYSYSLNTTYQPYRYRYTQKLAIKPADFAKMCISLDLGQQYQKHLDSVFAGENRHEVRRQMIRAQKDLLLVQAHRARLRQHISEAAFSVLKTLLDGGSPRYNGHGVWYSGLELLGSALGEVFIIGCTARTLRLPMASWQFRIPESFLLVQPSVLLDRPLAATEQKVIVYIPGAGRHELAEYDSMQDLEKQLAIALRSPSMQRRFIGLVKHDEQQTFLRRCKAQRYGKRWNPKGFYEEIDNPTPNLAVRETLLVGSLFETLHERHQTRMRDNARLLAVPTAVVDNEALWARLKHYAEIGLDILNVAAFFVPVLGHVMLAVTAVQLSLEVYHGIEAWQLGDREEAWAHFESVALNIGFAAALMGAGAAARVAPRIQVSRWVDGLVPVKLPSRKARLWKPDIEPYRADVQLEPNLQPNALGQYRVDGKVYVRLGEGLYEKTFDSELNQWRIKHPDNPEAYQPRLEHNHAGAWRHAHERPLEWDRLTLLRRMGHAVEGFSDETLQQIADASGVHDDALRKMHIDRTPPPPALMETLSQYKVDREVGEMIEHIRQGTCARGLCEYALPLLVEMPTWPSGESVEVYQGAQLSGESQRHGAVSEGAGARPGIKLTRDEVSNGQWPARVLSALDEEQIGQLLGKEAARAVHQREQVFRDRLANFALGRQRALFDSLYHHEPVDPDVARLQRHFPGLSRHAARYVLEQASAGELATLRSTGRIALRIASEVRVHVQQGLLNRALAGLSLENMASASSDKLALHGLQQLPDWPADLRVEIRNDSISGALLDRIGSEQASRCKILVKQGDSFQAFDQDARVLNPKPSQGRNLYESLAAALPNEMPVTQASEPAQALQQRLAHYGATHRDEMALLLKQRPINTRRGPSMRLASGRLGYLASGRGEGFADALLINRARMVYPNLSDEQAGEFIKYHLRSGKTDQQVMHLLNNRQRECDSLGMALSAWTQADQAPLRYGAPNRRMIAERIMTGWREGFMREAETASVLDLRDADSVPLWDADFSNVRTLHLRSEQVLGEVGSELLGRFRNLKRLNIVVQQQHVLALSQKLRELTTLTELSLAVDDVVDTSALSAALRGMPQLQELALQDWNQALDVSSSSNLRALRVHGSISGWPAGVLDLSQLETLDLRNTSINTLPAQLFTGHQQLWRGLALNWALLEPPAFAQVYEYLASHLPHQLGEEQMLEAYCQARLRRLIPDDYQFPGSALAQFKARGLSGRALLDRVVELHLEHDRFTQQLDEWQARVVHVDRRLVDVYTRRLASGKIRDCWYEVLRARYAAPEPVAGPSRHTLGRTPQVANEVLDLAGGPLGDLPALAGVTFDHVRHLDLTGARLSAQELNGFLGKFPNLRQLNLGGNRLTLLPPAFDALDQLENLYLSGNELSITPSLQQRLNRLTSLRTLSLAYNRVGELNVGSLAALEVLDLSHTATQTWPAGALQLSHLRRLDLSHSALTQVPAEVFAGHAPLLTGLKLQGCRLAQPTLTALQRYAEVTTLDTPGGIAREQLLAGRTGGAPEFFPIEVHEEPNLLIPVPLDPVGSDTRLTPALRLHRLDPDLSMASAIRRIDELGEEGLGALQIQARLQEWSQQHQALIGSLNDWIDTPAYREGDDWISAIYRRRAADRILGCWRETLRAPLQVARAELDISNLSVGDLPQLPVALDHVTTLNVSGVRLSAQGSDGFFRSFTHLERLAINGNLLTDLPRSLSQCEQLTRLDANFNDFRDGVQLHQQLRVFPRLEWLDLGENTLGSFDVRGLDRLRTLDLTGNILGEWPEGVLEAPALTSLNLSNNQIDTIPADALLPAHAGLMGGTDVSDNLLQEEDLRRLRDYLQDTGRGLGFNQEDIDRVLEGYELSDDDSTAGTDDEAHPSDETPAKQKERWFSGVAEDSEKHQVWAFLKEQEGGEDFFKVLSQLQHTKDFKGDETDVVRRVWQVLYTAYDNEALRTELFSLAKALRVRETCGDGRILVFSDLEIKAYELNALKGIDPEHKGRELLKLSRGLFRLDKVEAIARAASLRNPSLDAAEIRLAYRIGLAQRLELPRQPRTMIYANLARVTPQDLDAAYAAVLAEERQPEFVEQLVGRSYWLEYLEEKYPTEFSELHQRFAARSDELEELHPDFDDAHFQAWEALNAERVTERQLLALRLSKGELGEPAP